MGDGGDEGEFGVELQGDVMPERVRELEAALEAAHAALVAQQAEGERLALELADALCNTQKDLAALQTSSRAVEEALALKEKDLIASQQLVTCLRLTVSEASKGQDMTSRAARRQKELEDENSLLLKQTKELEGQVALAQQQLCFSTQREETTSASLSLVRGHLEEAKKECANSQQHAAEQASISAQTQAALEFVRHELEEAQAQAQSSNDMAADAATRLSESEVRLKEEVSKVAVRDREVERLSSLCERVSHELAQAQQRLKEEEALSAGLSQQIQESQCLARRVATELEIERAERVRSDVESRQKNDWSEYGGARGGGGAAGRKMPVTGSGYEALPAGLVCVHFVVCDSWLEIPGRIDPEVAFTFL